MCKYYPTADQIDSLKRLVLKQDWLKQKIKSELYNALKSARDNYR